MGDDFGGLCRGVERDGVGWESRDPTQSGLVTLRPSLRDSVSPKTRPSESSLQPATTPKILPDKGGTGTGSPVVEGARKVRNRGLEVVRQVTSPTPPPRPDTSSPTGTTSRDPQTPNESLVTPVSPPRSSRTGRSLVSAGWCPPHRSPPGRHSKPVWGDVEGGVRELVRRDWGRGLGGWDWEVKRGEGG